MICEMCGRDVTFCKKVTIEGVLLQVCAECAKFGIEEKKEAPSPPAPKPVIAKRLEVREKRSRPKDVLQAVEKEELIEDFAKVIRTARERAGMTQKELAMKINERVTIISKIESNQMRPDEKVISKLQKELNIVLKEKVPEVPAAKEGSKAALTLADLIKMKED
ncbi:MAG: multiprotein bridging factor aMBF1 [Thermoplasmata archaeon]